MIQYYKAWLQFSNNSLQFVIKSHGLEQCFPNAVHRKHTGGRYHCVFAVTNEWKSRLESIGFEVKLMGQPVAGDVVATDSADSNVAVAEESGVFENTTPLEMTIRVNDWIVNLGLKEMIQTDPLVKAIIEDLKPDLEWEPLSLNYGYPDNILPPAFLGLPTNSETEVKKKYRHQVWERSREMWYKYRDQLVSMGCLKLQEFLIWTPSP
ncbi:unnamed protein product [Oppiella nova]|uniref:Uncharacterized protein n=1 Tax=Oppiella nova TaxID=334625 RepID=A0A7R9MFT6_9ACAR|nr:unnamed protein product [Oppiella nova]CAG2176603.1 unnamed protein product [Oppiella nova]